jgi:hypothetical protein
MAMALFKRKPENVIVELEREISALRDRRGALEQRLAAAGDELAQSSEARRKHLVEGDVGDVDAIGKADARVAAALSAKSGIEDALAQVKDRIIEAERRLVEVKDGIARETEAKTRGQDADVIESALRNARVAHAELIEALTRVLPIPPVDTTANGVQFLAQQMEVGVEMRLANIRSCVAGVRTGTVAIAAGPSPLHMPVSVLQTPLPPVDEMPHEGGVRPSLHSAFEFEEIPVGPAKLGFNAFDFPKLLMSCYREESRYIRSWDCSLHGVHGEEYA